MPDNAPCHPRGIATVCLSGTIEDKLLAAAQAGFDGVEIFENDLLATSQTPEQLRGRCRDLGLRIDLYQPFRDFEAAPHPRLAANLRRAERKFDLMRRLGADTVLVCSSVAPDTVDDDDLAAEQLHELAERAAQHGIRIAYEALAWGRFVNTYDHSWDIVARADHPALGLCLDSFHILSRASDPAGIADIPGEKLFFLQLADAPRMHMDPLQWSRHHRVFPGQGNFDLKRFLNQVLATGYTGPLSLEVFNDVYRQAEPRRTAVDAMRSLIALEESVGAPLPEAPSLTGHAFTELTVDEPHQRKLTETLAALGFTLTGRRLDHAVDLWEQNKIHIQLASRSSTADARCASIGMSGTDSADSAGKARSLSNTGDSSGAGSAGKARSLSNTGDLSGASKTGQPNGTSKAGGASISALAVESTDPDASCRRAEALLAPVRSREPGTAAMPAVIAPDGSRIVFCGPDSDWRDRFRPSRGARRAEASRAHIGGQAAGPGPVGGHANARASHTGGQAHAALTRNASHADANANANSEPSHTSAKLTHVDHIALTQPFDHFDEAALFFHSVLGLDTEDNTEYAAPFGLVRARALSDADHHVRIALSVALVRRGEEWSPGVPAPQHIAFATDDIFAVAATLQTAGTPPLPIPGNYYDDLDARLAPPRLAELREHHVLYDRDADGEFLHLYTPVLGDRVFFEVCQRIGGYLGYGTVNTPIRMAAHRRQRLAARSAAA